MEILENGISTLIHSNLYHFFKLISDNLLLLKNIKDAAVIARAADVEVNSDNPSLHCE